MSAAVGAALAVLAALYVLVMISDRARARRHRLDADGGPAERGHDEHGQAHDADAPAVRVPVEGCPWNPCARCAGTVAIAPPAALVTLPARPRAAVTELPAPPRRRPRRTAA